MVLPKRLIDTILAFRFGIDQNAVGLEQAMLADFIEEGHLGRHMRRMRELYANRLQTLRREGEKHLKGLLEIPDVKAGLYAVGFLRNGMSSRQAESAAMSHGIETMVLDRFVLSGTDPNGIVIGFAAFDDHVIRRGVATLAIALSKCGSDDRCARDSWDYSAPQRPISSRFWKEWRQNTRRGGDRISTAVGGVVGRWEPSHRHTLPRNHPRIRQTESPGSHVCGALGNTADRSGFTNGIADKVSALIVFFYSLNFRE